ncbi:RNase P subunit [Candidatus Nitrosopelagicus sp.]|uniref:Ribonuclease P protein component 4 n=1 Tax=uncultured marine thaumarchaeote AD1000_54_F06 TaxID=1455925 RepID=A0A075FTH4_9ARCH|nr:putative RNAse P subunit domain protein (RPR2, RPP21) [uncultured marine thaumarchaeote AD1000_54_F06]MDC0159426.1 RNase P subunit [Candidatus Nitrosopelagicus sp.]|tara:strand:+ start:85 stop:384 length:300 start_codon:yes stop_codon:yes gene_type:complete
MKNSKKQIALKRMEILFNNAILNAKNNPSLAQKQAEIAKKISMKFKIKMPFEISSSFCKKCKKFISPGIASKIRLGSKPKSIRITCSYCNHTYRKIISQ